MTKLKQIFELELTDRDTLPTTSPPSKRSDNKSKHNPTNCADQWNGSLQTGPRQVTITSLGNSCDWTDTALADRMTQSEDQSHHQAWRG
jgi:hypothetical protein